ncbi:MAG: elongation factor P [Candidatus Berkelbacteria bacterium]
MLSITDLKTGVKFSMDGDPYMVLSYAHHKMGRGGAVVKTKIKNLRTGGNIDKTFQGSDKVDEADLSKKQATYLYKDETDAFFMDNSSYDQFTLPLLKIGEQILYMVEDSTVDILYFGDEPLNIELPIKMRFKVISAPPAVKGNSASSITKIVTLETGATASAPIFIKEGDTIVINTQDGSYVERGN